MPLGRIENWIKHIFTSIKIMIFHGKQLKHDFIRFHSDTERAKREKKKHGRHYIVWALGAKQSHPICVLFLIAKHWMMQVHESKLHLFEFDSIWLVNTRIIFG